MSEEVEARGWDAIDQEMERLYGDQEPKHYGTVIPYSLGGNDPLNGISAYKGETPLPHWHFVTYGFSELYEKESEDLEYSGYGFELTFRLNRGPDEEEPPAWALNLLQNMGRYVFRSGNVFQSGDYLDANGPICLNADTALTALAFAEDPQLPMIDTPNGKVQFIQMVGITKDELQAMQTWNTLGLLEVCQPYMPYYITDLTRASFLETPAVAEAVNAGRERDGSNTGFLFVDQLAWEPEKKSLFKKTPAKLTLGAKQADIVGKLLRGRLLKGRNLTLVSSGLRVVFEPGEQAGWKTEAEEVQITLHDAAAAELSEKLLPKAGAFEVASLPGAVIEVVKTHIKDNEGNVVETIG